MWSVTLLIYLHSIQLLFRALCWNCCGHCWGKTQQWIGLYNQNNKLTDAPMLHTGEENCMIFIITLLNLHFTTKLLNTLHSIFILFILFTLTTAFCSTRAFTCSNFPDTTRGKIDESAPLQNSRYSPGSPQTHTYNKKCLNKLQEHYSVFVSYNIISKQ